MDTPMHLPLALFKAQAALALQTLGLLKTGRQRWLELGAGQLADDVAQTESALTALQAAEDWSALAALLPDAYWQAQQRWASLLQGVVQTAINNQSHFVTEYQSAVLAWQQASVQALSTARNAMPVHTVLEGALSAFGTPFAALTSATGITPSPAPTHPKGNGAMTKTAS